MTAEDVREALRRRYPARIEYGADSWSPGAWTTLCEWMGIDLTAFSAWGSPKGPHGGVSHPIVGHEIKISRGDYRRELRAPHKRTRAVSFCTQFYFAVPDGLLKPEEIAWKPPGWLLDHDSWRRVPCPDSFEGGNRHRGYPTPCDRGKRQIPMIGPPRRFQTYRDTVTVKCETCGGRGYSERSRIEREAPTLWIPADVGLITIKDSGTTIVKKAPVRPSAPERTFPLGLGHDDNPSRRRAELCDLIRWVSVRPDPRHAR